MILTLTGEARTPRGQRAPKDMPIFCYGWAGLYRDGVEVVDGNAPPARYRDAAKTFTVRHAERYAARRPGQSVWEIKIRAPLWDATWRRVAPGKWVAVDAGRGFA